MPKSTDENGEYIGCQWTISVGEALAAQADILVHATDDLLSFLSDSRDRLSHSQDTAFKLIVRRYVSCSNPSLTYIIRNFSFQNCRHLFFSEIVEDQVRAVVGVLWSLLLLGLAREFLAAPIDPDTEDYWTRLGSGVTAVKSVLEFGIAFKVTVCT